jgi:hypothetical protein
MNQRLHFIQHNNFYQNILKLIHKCLNLKPSQIIVNSNNKINKNLKKLNQLDNLIEMI